MVSVISTRVNILLRQIHRSQRTVGVAVFTGKTVYRFQRLRFAGLHGAGELLILR